MTTAHSAAHAAIVSFAKSLAKKKDMDWVQANNLIFGPNGKLIELCPTLRDRQKFAATAAFDEVHDAIGSLPPPKTSKAHPGVKSPAAANGKMLIRVPKTLHAALLVEAEAEGISLNQLCLAKLAVQLAAVAR